MTGPTAIHWFRRDLRLHDNTALHAALQSGLPVLPVFILDPALLQSPYVGAPRLAFLLDGLRALDAELALYGGRLLICRGRPHEVLPQLIREHEARALYFNRDYSPLSRRRDAQVSAAAGVPVHIYDDALLVNPEALHKGDGSPYTVYTPFWRKWQSLPKNPVSSSSFRGGQFATVPGPGIGQMLAEPDSLSPIAAPPAGPGQALSRLQAFMDGPIYHYSMQRNALPPDPFALPRPDGPSYLSPWLRFGMLSPRQAYWAARAAWHTAPGPQARESVTTWVSELAWREFYVHILHHFPHVMQRSFRGEYDALPWRDAPDELAAWQEGQTGYPLVDAAMRQLKAVGWMPNRARMVVASFLTRHLLIDWRAGERHFMQWLLDGDPAANNGGWQWAAGTGTDAQPYFRIFNPTEQARRFDPQGHYIRRWVPELHDVPDTHIHEPWQMPHPPRSYPPPIIKHKIARERALSAYRSLKNPR